MLALAFTVGDRTYGLDTSEVAVVMPRPLVRPLDGTPPWLVGVFRHRGAFVPLVDLCQRLLGRPSTLAFSTRAVVVRYRREGAPPRLLAVLAEHATEVVDVDDRATETPVVATPALPWLGVLARDERGTPLQFVRLTELLPEDVRALLYPADVTSTVGAQTDPGARP